MMGQLDPVPSKKTTDREYGWLFLEASVDEQEQFEFKEIPCGSGWIYAGVKEEEPVIAEADVKLEPNRLFQRVVLVKFERPSDPETPPVAPDDKNAKPVVWVDGTGAR